MSGSSDDDISNADRDGYGKGGSDGDDDDDDDSEIENRQPRRMRRGFGKDMGKMVLHQFTKAKKKLRRIRSRRVLVPSASSSLLSSRNEDSDKLIISGEGSGSGCRFCFSRPKVLESPSRSPTTGDPNDPKFTYAMLKTLIEKNDFYSKDCNPHLG